jgi:cysteine desulfurase
MTPVYLDNNATTRVDPEAVAAMLPFFTEQLGNASSMHAFGSEVGGALKIARRQIQDLLGAEFDHEIIYTSGGTESDNTAILSALETQGGRNEVITSVVEHPAVLSLCDYLEKHRGVVVHRIPVDSRGRLDIDAYRAALGPRTAIASVMWANNETGTLFPVGVLARLAHDAGALFHTDAVQAAGKLAIDVQATPIDMLSLSAHKLHGPKGVGALYVRRKNPRVQLVAQIDGGGHERGMRSGTLNVPGIVGLGKACAIGTEDMAEEAKKLAGLRDRLKDKIMGQLDEAYLNGSLEHRLPGNLNISFAYVEGESLLMGINDIAVSSGSACTSATLEPSYVLKALGAGDDLAHSSIRFGIGRFNTEAEVDYVAARVVDTVKRLRELSPLYEMAREGVDLTKVQWAAEPSAH